MNNKIHINNLSFAFSHDQERLFDNVSLVLQPGTFYLLVGPNGVGKSTFFRLCQGDVRPEEIIDGSMHIGNRTFILHEHRPTPVFYVPQRYDDMLVQELTVRENLAAATFATIPGLRSAQPDRRLEELITGYNLPLDERLGALSGGQRQLVSLSMALVKDVSLILLDEPTAALDTVQSRRMIDLLVTQAQKRAITVIASCHDQKIIQRQPSGSIIEIIPAGNARAVQIR